MGVYYMFYLCSRPNCKLLFSTTIRFRVTGHSETSATKDPKMTLDSTGSKVLYIYHKNAPEPQILVRFFYDKHFSSYCILILNLQAILRQVHWMTLKWHWGLTDQRHSTYVVLWYLGIPKFVPSCPMPSSFKFQSIFILELQIMLRQVHNMPPQWHWTL